ncbi:dirigent protein 1-like [Olea europaea var. sylvestris]|uniref:dirigent protein 1-like n=1 Tax=Olea europaea var. sylvestris TaxID=158386 RepID=UPI000C1CDD91|nr:dirigent protein 1-like [Olea europaea var. sylvestris]
MGRKCIISVLYAILIASIAMPVVLAIDKRPVAVERWFKKLPHAKEKLTKLHFFFHDVVSGKNTTVVRVAESKATAKSPTVFGAVFVMDDPLTEGPKPDSKIVGRAQGIYSPASMEEICFLMTLNFVFTNGQYNGSSLSVVGHNAIFNKYREMPILGGSGHFRLARGIATAKTYLISDSGNAIVEYNVMVLHY